MLFLEYFANCRMWGEGLGRLCCISKAGTDTSEPATLVNLAHYICLSLSFPPFLFLVSQLTQCGREHGLLRFFASSSGGQRYDLDVTCVWLGLCLARNACVCVRSGECGPPCISALGGRGQRHCYCHSCLFLHTKSLVLSSMKMGTFVGHLSSGCRKDK